MAQEPNISLVNKGMQTDIHQYNLDESGYSFAMNGMVSDFYHGNEFQLGNEPSNMCNVEFPPNYQVVGFVEIPEQKRTIYFLTNPTNGNSQIGEVKNCIYTLPTDKIEKVYCATCPEYKGTERTGLENSKEVCHCQYRMIIQANCLNLNVGYPVDIEYKITSCGLNLYFTDNNNERSYLYFKYENDDLNGDLIIDEKFLLLGEPQVQCFCPEGYTYNPETELCEKITVTPITPSGDLRTACKVNSTSWGIQGVALYSTYNIDGTGTSTIHHLTDPFWSNPGGFPNQNGSLNRTGLWACGPGGTSQVGEMTPFNEPIGFIFPVDVATTTTYYIGIAGDNTVRIRVNCEDIVNMDPDAMALQYPGVGITAPFQYWHVYPVVLTPGRHVIELTGINYGSVGGFGAEIYANTSAEIIAANGGTGLNTIFSTLNMVGEPLQVSTSFSGECAEGQCLDINDLGELICTSVETAEPDCADCEIVTYLDELDCEKIKVHPVYNKPCVEFIELVGGGNLKEGVYQILIAYADQYGNPITEYFPASQTIPVYKDPIKFDTNGVTGKAIKFQINNLKINNVFQHYNLVVAETIEQFTNFVKVGTFNNTQREYTYTGFEKATQSLAPQEVLFKRPFYEKAKGVTKANNYLFWNGVTEYETLNLQPVANKINLGWQTVALKEGAYHDPKNTFYFHTYQRDEVYAFGIVFEFDNGRESCAFHIPGRAAISTDLDVIVSDDVIDYSDCTDDPRNLRWQVYNTGTVLGGDYEYNENCDIDKCWEYGNFAYWESTELYPSVPEVWGELCGKPIRHHKFPDSCVTHIHDSAGGTKVFKDANYIFPIGVRVDHQSVLNALEQAVTDGLITQKQRDSIVSYRIVRGNRVGNKSIDAKGLLFNMFNYEKYDKTYHFSNYAYNDLSADSFLNGTELSPGRYTFHSPDTHFVNAELGDVLKLEAEEYGESEGYFTHSDCQSEHKFLNTFASLLALGLGIAAAISATGEKQCRVITYQGPTDIVHGEMHVDQATITQWQQFTGTTTSAPVPGGGIGAHDINQDNSTNNHNTTDGTGQGTDPITGEPIDIDNYANEQITYCTGQSFQVFNSDSTLATWFSGANQVIQRTFLGIAEMQKILDTIRAIIGHKNYTVQYNSIGKYNNYLCPDEGNKQRKLIKTAYLLPQIQEIDEPSLLPDTLYENIKINNWHRESSVYLKTGGELLANPTTIDNSKVNMDEVGLDVGDLNKTINRTISSYYASIKRYVPNQYGQICNINYIETNSCSFKLNTLYSICEAKVFGGDTFINRFGLKRKMPFFLHTQCNLPDDSDIKYSELGNVADPKFYFDTPVSVFERITSLTNIFGLVGALTSDLNANFDVTENNLFAKEGYIHLFNYGIPYFLVESDINVDYRHGQNNKERDFYPHKSDLKDWLEEENVPISEDNYYFYNRTYSKQNLESEICTSCISNPDNLKCQATNINRIIYSEPSNTENKNDNWLINKANDYYDFPLTLGKLITADGIENNKVLVRLEKGSQMFPAYNTIQATEENIQVGTGGMFQSNPQDIAITDLGYAGTQHKDILHTEYGHIWADAERGQVFKLETGGKGMDELSKDGMKNWFKENLPFQILKDFPNMPVEDIDNNLNGIGLHFCFDKRFHRFLITKLDYKKINPDVTYNKEEKKFYVGEDEVTLGHPKYFCSKKWTISYNFYTKTWTSFHSYTPEFYVEHIDGFESGYKGFGNIQKTYAHNMTNKSYQVFYGKLEPFIVELNSKFSGQNNYLTNIEYLLDVIRYHNEYDTFYNRTKTFNKAIIYNNNQTSGLLTMKVKNPEDLSQNVEYPKRIETGYEILTTNSENKWSFNDFFDVSKNQLNNIPLFNYDCNNVNKKLNNLALDYDKPDHERQGIRGRNCRIRLINDKESNYKYIFTLGIIQNKPSIR